MATNKRIVKNVKKQNSHNGWVPKVTKSVILVCSECEIKYIKTRPGQITCIKCSLAPVAETVFRLHKDR